MAGFFLKKMFQRKRVVLQDRLRVRPHPDGLVRRPQHEGGQAPGQGGGVRKTEEDPATAKEQARKC